jgi:colanic acid/amylovoran biosynthesis protein
MRILIDNSGYHLLNLGDIAMLQMTVSRVKALWPEASIGVITYSNERLEKYCPGTSSVGLDFLENPIISGLPSKASFAMVQFHKIILPQLLSIGRYGRKKDHGSNKDILPESLSLFEALVGADLVIASGGGYITDTFKLHGIGVMNILSYAIHLGKPTAMFGQGIGPLGSKWFIQKAKSILPKVDLIALREGRFGPELLQSLGVETDKIIVTGDDTIEMVYSVRAPKLGEALGINLRIAHYSGVNQQIADRIKTVIQNGARQHHAQVIPIPISLYAKDSDSKAIKTLVASSDQLEYQENIDTPIQVIQQIGRCRVIVTGSYHAAVFALAQGVPVVCLTNSAYYDYKFAGLADLFGDSCHIVSIGDLFSNDKLSNAINQAWETADSLYLKTLSVANNKIKLSIDAYRRFFNIVNKMTTHIQINDEIN